MTALLRRRRRRPAARPVIVARTTHWVVRGNEYFRDCVVQFPDGSRRIVPVRERAAA